VPEILEISQNSLFLIEAEMDGGFGGFALNKNTCKMAAITQGIAVIYNIALIIDVSFCTIYGAKKNPNKIPH